MKMRRKSADNYPRVHLLLVPIAPWDVIDR
jgi:hypothetical protein